MFPLSETTRTQLALTIREFQIAHSGEDLPKIDDAYQRLYPEQITLYAFRDMWLQVQRELAESADERAERAKLRAEIEAELRAEVAAQAAPQQDPADHPADLPAGELVN